MQLNKLDHGVARKAFKKWFHRQYINMMDKQLASNVAIEYQSYEQSPIIVLGMHRSGTSLLIDALTSLGLFAGDITGPDTSESLLFQYLNDAALHTAQAHWSTPENLQYALKNEYCISSLLNLFDHTLKSHWQHFYKITSPKKTILGQAGAFGWKDPRNCLTLPLWSKLFPNARYVFIYRHGVDVALSHVNRERRVKNSAYVARCLELDRSFTLWEEYNKQALKAFESIDQQQKMFLSFEELLESPKELLTKLADFCDLEKNSIELDKFAKRCNKDKAFAYTKNELTLSEYVYQSTVLQQLHYTV